MLVSRIGSFEGLRVADLFAGSGALGLEALSRGASHCLFVDRDGDANAAIRRNLRTLNADGEADVRQQLAETAPPPPQPCHLIFIDPPYASGLQDKVLHHVADARWIEPGGLISIESDRGDIACPPGLAIEAARRFGKAHIHLFRQESQVV
jgi:16S rRNA (guanine966-N2)-methyltransferase